MSEPQLRNCCGTTDVWFGPVQTQRRGMPPIIRRSRKVFHQSGESIFWHWFDQRRNLA